MRAELRKVSSGATESFSVRRDLVPDINNRWHYHDVVELICFKEGSGTHFIGDNIRRFHNNDVVLIGSNLPHFTRFDSSYFTQVNPNMLVLHFREDFWGNTFLNIPENAPVKSLLERSRRGILINGEAGKKVAHLMEEMLEASPQSRLLMLMQILYAIAEGKAEERLLSSMGFSAEYSESEQDRISAIYDYTLNHFQRKIYLEEIAEVAKLAPESFCRYFKSRMKKTYSDFVLEIRVGHACKLLIEDNFNLKQICYESGFNNGVTFHRYFKRYTGMSPTNYRKEFGLGR
ncbi:AraC family transcriptional regulator [Pedobacter sp. SYSU D00535]|uniref:AraC family transcriptional regulator n=1 Tax=Pedobacter sp. SYSU D00535 TaxID=2810308 RepID=UPI001A96C2A2|nr:AraC family transcriptional regulator [Pedobacter sp. SYSU D00535]